MHADVHCSTIIKTMDLDLDANLSSAIYYFKFLNLPEPQFSHL